MEKIFLLMILIFVVACGKKEVEITKAIYDFKTTSNLEVTEVRRYYEIESTKESNIKLLYTSTIKEGEVFLVYGNELDKGDYLDMSYMTFGKNIEKLETTLVLSKGINYISLYMRGKDIEGKAVFDFDLEDNKDIKFRNVDKEEKDIEFYKDIDDLI